MNKDVYKLALGLVKGIGPVLGRNLVAYIGGVEALFKESNSALLKVPGISLKLVDSIRKSDMLDRAKRELDFVIKNNIKTLFFTDDNYPYRLNQCADAPLLLFQKGDQVSNYRKVIGVVGTRKLSPQGAILCNNLISDLSLKYPDLVVVSGLAYGADICAHRSALLNQLKTIAVLGNGLDSIYPYVHRKDADKIQNAGALLSEFYSGTGPDRPNFVKRNRIIAGMVDAIVVVESAEKGGSLITAHLAHSYSRDVLAFPGRVADEYSKGCNALIKKNIAALIESVDDVEYCLGWQQVKGGVQQRIEFSMINRDKEESSIYSILSEYKEMDVNSLCRMADLPVSKVSSVLLGLEFEGIVKSLPGNRYCKV